MFNLLLPILIFALFIPYVVKFCNKFLDLLVKFFNESVNKNE